MSKPRAIKAPLPNFLFLTFFGHCLFFQETDPRGVTVGQASKLGFMISFSIISLATFVWQLVKSITNLSSSKSATFLRLFWQQNSTKSGTKKKASSSTKNFLTKNCTLLWNPLDSKKLIVTHFLTRTVLAQEISSLGSTNCFFWRFYSWLFSLLQHLELMQDLLTKISSNWKIHPLENRMLWELTNFPWFYACPSL